MKVSFELSNRDLTYFRDRLKRIRKSLDTGDERKVLRGAKSMMQEARDSNPPEFVLERLIHLEQLIAMLEDDEWRLEGRDRVRILDALAYFVDPEDMIPDRLPGIGYLDDAIMVELICQELRHEIKALELKSCEYEVDRNRQLFEMGLLPEDDVRKAETDKERAVIELAHLEFQLANAETDLANRLEGLNLEIAILTKDAEQAREPSHGRPIEKSRPLNRPRAARRLRLRAAGWCPSSAERVRHRPGCRGQAAELRRWCRPDAGARPAPR